MSQPKEFLFRSRTFKYEFSPSEVQGAPLLVVLHGHNKSPRASKLRAPDWNVLCPVDDFGLKGCGAWYLGEKGDHFWLEAMPALIAHVYDGPDICFMGSSMGGYGSILHGIRNKAFAVYANIAQTHLLGSSYANQGMRPYFEALFDTSTESDFNDLRNLIEPSIKTKFLLSGMRWDKPNYLTEQTMPFIQSLIDHDVPFGLDLHLQEGHKLAIPLHEAAQKLTALFAERTGHSDAPPPLQPTPAIVRTAPASTPSPAPSDEARTLVRNTLNHPDQMWTESKAHMALRFEKFLDKYTDLAHLPDRSKVVPYIETIANSRLTDRPPTVFVVNPGSSGSHWLQAVLKYQYGVGASGEAYLPPAMMTFLQTASAVDRGYVQDCMHLTYSATLEDGADKALMNTAHASGWKLSEWMPGKKSTLLLTRDPLSVVLSRTFRKDNHRLKFFPHQNDETYLMTNVEYVSKFYNHMTPDNYDSIVRFEDMTTDMAGVLKSLTGLTGLEHPIHSIVDTVAHFAAKEQTTNKFRGEAKPIDPVHTQTATKILGDLRRTLGYEHSESA